MEEVKLRRLQELITVFREEATKANKTSVGCTQLVLVEGVRPYVYTYILFVFLGHNMSLFI